MTNERAELLSEMTNEVCDTRINFFKLLTDTDNKVEKLSEKIRLVVFHVSYDVSVYEVDEIQFSSTDDSTLILFMHKNVVQYAYDVEHDEDTLSTESLLYIAHAIVNR